MDALNVDALLVLGGEDRQLWPRCSAALHFYLDCSLRGLKPPRLIVSGGKVVRHNNKWSTESALMVRFFTMRGIPQCHLLEEPHATDTFGNVVLGGALAVMHDLKQVAIVTDDFHHWRSGMIFTQVFGTAPGRFLHTGVRGSLGARIRERLAYWALRIELRVASVQEGDLDAHQVFLMRKHRKFSRAMAISDPGVAACPDHQGQSGNGPVCRVGGVAPQGLNP